MTGTSILNDVKKLLGYDPTYTEFDIDIIAAINSIFFVLNQLGIGPTTPYVISDNTSKWSDFSTVNAELVKSYVFLRVRTIFDPTQSSAVSEATKQLIAEFEWRLQVAFENLTQN